MPQLSSNGWYARFAVALFEQGVWVARRGIWYVSAAHAHADVTETVDRVKAAIKVFAAAEL
ncbi:MAG TPA: hypothetical protein VFI65_05425 [Streptosporangiaceae bacterium]|nr:hypothetical protein [Streptosporangiaceae bacterium]